MTSAGRPVGSGTYTKLELQSLCITTAAELWRDRRRAPTLESVADHIGYTRSGLGHAFTRLGIRWPDVWREGRRLTLGHIKTHVAV